MEMSEFPELGVVSRRAAPVPLPCLSRAAPVPSRAAPVPRRRAVPSDRAVPPPEALGRRKSAYRN